MKLNPLGGLVIAYISANHSNEWKGDSRMPEELQKLQTAIPTLPLDYMYPFMADVEIDQLIQYLRGLVVRKENISLPLCIRSQQKGTKLRQLQIGISI